VLLKVPPIPAVLIISLPPATMVEAVLLKAPRAGKDEAEGYGGKANALL